MKSRVFALSGALAVFAVSAPAVFAHCQIPCGIYDDPARFVEMQEHVTTIEKSMNEIVALSKEASPNWNQIVRWVMNKEDHADKLTEIVSYYFMAQRVKPADPSDKAASAKYVQQLTLLHRIMVHAMKAKQTTDLEQCAAMRELIKQFQASYLGDTAQHTGGTHQHADGTTHRH
jgi:nickel superoxide dismutase